MAKVSVKIFIFKIYHFCFSIFHSRSKRLRVTHPTIFVSGLQMFLCNRALQFIVFGYCITGWVHEALLSSWLVAKWGNFLLWRTYVFFGGPLIPCFGLPVTSTLGFKARVDFALARFFACMLFLWFTSGATPADCIEVSMAASHILYMRVAEVGCPLGHGDRL